MAMRKFITTVKRLNASTKYSIYLIKQGKVESDTVYQVEKWIGGAAFPDQIWQLTKAKVWENKFDQKNLKLPRFVINAILAERLEA